MVEAPVEKKPKLPRPRPTDSANSTPKQKRAKFINASTSSPVNKPVMSPKSISEQTNVSKQAMSHHSHDELDEDCDWLMDAGFQLVDAPINPLFLSIPPHESFPSSYLHVNHYQSQHGHHHLDSSLLDLHLNLDANIHPSNINHRLHDYDLAWLSELEFSSQKAANSTIISQPQLHDNHQPGAAASLTLMFDMNMRCNSNDRDGSSIITCTTAESSEQDGFINDPDHLAASTVYHPTERVTGKPLSMLTQLQQPTFNEKDLSAGTTAATAPAHPVVRKRGRPRRIPLPQPDLVQHLPTSMPTESSSLTLSINTINMDHLGRSVDRRLSSSTTFSNTSIHVWDDEEAMGGLLEAFA
jgi:hypothetical protein